MTEEEIREFNEEVRAEAFEKMNPWRIPLIFSVVYFIAWMAQHPLTDGIAALVGIIHMLAVWGYPLIALVALVKAHFKLMFHYVLAEILLIGIGIAYGSTVGAF